MTSKYYHYYKSMQRCVRCRKMDAYTMAGRSMCAVCAEKDRERKAEKYRNDAEFRARKRERDRNSYFAARAAGVCANCRRRPPKEGSPYCWECFAKRAAWNREHKEWRDGENYPRGANGFCHLCNKKPSMDGKRLCEECYGKAVERMAKARAVRNIGGNP